MNKKSRTKFVKGETLESSQGCTVVNIEREDPRQSKTIQANSLDSLLNFLQPPKEESAQMEIQEQDLQTRFRKQAQFKQIYKEGLDLLKRMGFKAQKGLGRKQDGILQPVQQHLKTSFQGCYQQQQSEYRKAGAFEFQLKRYSEQLEIDQQHCQRLLKQKKQSLQEWQLLDGECKLLENQLSRLRTEEHQQIAELANLRRALGLQIGSLLSLNQYCKLVQSACQIQQLEQFYACKVDSLLKACPSKEQLMYKVLASEFSFSRKANTRALQKLFQMLLNEDRLQVEGIKLLNQSYHFHPQAVTKFINQRFIRHLRDNLRLDKDQLRLFQQLRLIKGNWSQLDYRILSELSRTSLEDQQAVETLWNSMQDKQTLSSRFFYPRFNKRIQEMDVCSASSCRPTLKLLLRYSGALLQSHYLQLVKQIIDKIQVKAESIKEKGEVGKQWLRGWLEWLLRCRKQQFVEQWAQLMQSEYIQN